MALFTGKGPNGQDYSRGAQLKFEKSVGREVPGAEDLRPAAQAQPEFEIRDWE